MIKIKPINRLPICQVSLGEIRIDLKGATYASAPYFLHTIDNVVVESGIVTFSKQELDVWSDDDTVLNTLLLEKLNYELDDSGE